MGREAFLKVVKYGFFYPVAAVFPLPTAYRFARAWGRMEARRNTGLAEAVQKTAETVLGASVPSVLTGNIGEKFFEMISCDEIDAYVPLIHPWQQLQKWVQINGEDTGLALPEHGQGVLLLTFHVGGGSLIFPYLRHRGVSAHYLSISLARAREISGVIQYLFGRFRLWGIRKVMGQDIIFVGGSKDKIRRVLRQGGTVVALLDVVPESLHIKEQAEVPFFGRPARFPTGLLSTAAETGALLVPFFGRVGDDLCRHLSFESSCRIENIEGTLKTLVSLLETYIRRYPQEWHFWPGLQHFYV